MSALPKKLSGVKLKEINLVIDRLGGPAAAASFLRCKHPAVCQWRYFGIPPQRVMYLQAVRPDALIGTRYQVKEAQTAE